MEILGALICIFFIYFIFIRPIVRPIVEPLKEYNEVRKPIYFFGNGKGYDNVIEDIMKQMARNDDERILCRFMLEAFFEEIIEQGVIELPKPSYGVTYRRKDKVHKALEKVWNTIVNDKDNLLISYMLYVKFMENKHIGKKIFDLSEFINIINRLRTLEINP